MTPLAAENGRYRARRLAFCSPPLACRQQVRTLRLFAFSRCRRTGRTFLSLFPAGVTSREGLALDGAECRSPDPSMKPTSVSSRCYLRKRSRMRQHVNVGGFEPVKSGFVSSSLARGLSCVAAEPSALYHDLQTTGERAATVARSGESKGTLRGGGGVEWPRYRLRRSARHRGGIRDCCAACVHGRRGCPDGDLLEWEHRAPL